MKRKFYIYEIYKSIIEVDDDIIDPKYASPKNKFTGERPKNISILELTTIKARNLWGRLTNSERMRERMYFRCLPEEAPEETVIINKGI